MRDLLKGKWGTRATDRTRFALFSGAGFSPELRSVTEAAQNVSLIDLDRLYHGE